MTTMNKMLLVSVLAIGLSGFQSRAQIPNPGSEGRIQLQWLKEYSQALKRAETERKPLLIDITTDWCGWSKKMERETFADSAVQKELRSCILIRLNPEASDANQKIAESFGVDGYPTLVLANYRGEELGVTSGYLSTKDFLEYLGRYLPLFKSNPLGYKSVELGATDPLMKAVRKIPAADAMPAGLGSFTVLDQSSIQIQGNGGAKMLIRTSVYIADPEKAEMQNVSRYYVSSSQKMKFKSVRILNTRGAGREVELRLAKDEHAYSNQNVYWDARIVSVPLPKLKEGQIVDVIEEREVEPVMPGEFYFRWTTGLEVLLSSDLAITFPASLKLQQRASRCPTEVTETKNGDGTITWHLVTSNPTPYEPAFFSPPLHEIWQGYEFYAGCSTDGLARWYAGLVQGREQLPALARQRVATLKKASTSQTALLQALSDWVTKDIRYVSVAFGKSSHQPHSVSDTLANQYGDCKDQALLLQSLCREAGIPASLVLLDASGEGFDPECPALERFNHCIVEATVGGKAYYLDPAWGATKIGHVAQAYAGSRALKLDGPTGRIVTLPCYEPQPNLETSVTTVKLNVNGSATISETAHLAGTRATLMKEQMKASTPDKVRKYLEASNKNAGRKLLDFFMTDPSEPGDTYETRITYTVPRFASMSSGGMAFQLGALGRKGTWIDALSMPRSQAFWFRATDPSKTSYIVELPPGARLKNRPEDVKIDTLFMKASRTVSFKDNKLTLAETSQMLDARLAGSQSALVYDAFRKINDHRDFSYVVEMPAMPAGQAVTAAPASLGGAGSASDNATAMLHLNGISGGGGNRLVMVNGKTLAVGESASLQIGGRPTNVKCISIGERSACFNVDGVRGTTELQLKE